MTTAQQHLVRVAKDAADLLRKQVRGEYLSQHDDLSIGRQLVTAIAEVEAEERRDAARRCTRCQQEVPTSAIVQSKVGPICDECDFWLSVEETPDDDSTCGTALSATHDRHR